MSVARWWDKASSLAAAWLELHPGAELPGLPSVALDLAVAEGETRCGDSWDGEHNWGAVTGRALTPAERSAVALAGVRPSVGADHLAVEADARRAIELAVAAGTIPDPGPGLALHCDSLPGKGPGSGPYFVWFAAFDTDQAGAKYFLRTLERTAAERAAEASGSAPAEASAMYSAGYYKGFHDPRGLYELRGSKWVLLGPTDEPTEGAQTSTGAALNVADYAHGIASMLPGILSALAGWSPDADPPAEQEPAELDLGTIRGIQGALNAAGAAPALDVDGLWGPKSRAALEAFQRAHGLAVGPVCPSTLAALREAA